MAIVNYSTWTLARLQKEQQKIEKAIQQKESKDRSKALAAIKQAARKSGFAISELIDDLSGGGSKPAAGDAAVVGKKRSKKKASAGKKAGKKTGKVAPKYRNPNDPKETWSGRGRQPLWVVAYLKEHDDLDGVRI